MGRRRGVRTERLDRAREQYATALRTWLADKRRHEDGRLSGDLLEAARNELDDALDEAGVRPRGNRLQQPDDE